MQRGPSHHPASRMSGVWSLRILELGARVFPADCPHPTHCHCRQKSASSAGYSEFPAYSQMLTASLPMWGAANLDRKSTRLNSSHANISYAVFCLKKKK